MGPSWRVERIKMAEDGTLELQEICQDSLEKGDLSYTSEHDTLHFVSEEQEEAITDENGLGLHETTTDSGNHEGMKGQVLSKLHLIPFAGELTIQVHTIVVNRSQYQLITIFN